MDRIHKKRDRLQPQEFGQRMTQGMKRIRMTADDLAVETGIPVEDVQAYADGSRLPDHEDLGTIKDALRVTADWLLGLSINPDPAEQEHLTSSLKNRLMMLTVMHTTTIERIARRSGVDPMVMAACARGDGAMMADEIKAVCVEEFISADWLIGWKRRSDIE